MPLDKEFATPEEEPLFEEPKPTKRPKKEEVKQEEKEVKELDLSEDLKKLKAEADE